MRIEIAENHYLEIAKPGIEEELFALVEADRAYLGKFLNWVPKTTEVSHLLNFLTRNSDRHQDDRSGAFAIYYHKELVGLVDLHKIDKGHNKTTIGYWLRSDRQGKGIMSSSVKAILSYGFGDLDLKRIGIQAAVENKSSRALAERLGFHFEGIERAGNKLDGEVYLDMAIYSMLVEEFGSSGT